MELTPKLRMHPLAAGAAVAVIIVSAVAVAAMTGHLPGSNAAPGAAQQLAVAPAAPEPAVPPPSAAPAVAPPLSPSQQIASEAMAPQVAQAPVVQPAPAPACPSCGVVQSVGAFTQHPKNSPVGMIGGAVVGGVVGNQIGHGTTNTIATLGGAAGGAYLGNEIGKKYQTTTRYRVVVRMDDGRKRTFTYAARPQFIAGSHVRVENGRLVSES